MIEMYVQGVTLDPVTNMPIVVLKGKETEDILPIWIGIFEANAIAMQLEEVERPRPLTHDLITSIISSLSASVKNIIIHSLKNNTYYAEITVEKNGEEIKIDSRPSDAINIALRFNAPIFVYEDVISASKGEEEITEPNEEDLSEWLESIKPEDFKKTIEH
jgi:hypothetical protein